MHSRNKHQDRYDLERLKAANPALSGFIIKNKFGDDSIDFANAKAVRTLNQAILKADYKIDFWDIPEEFLCPPIPGRADYIHSAADLFSQKDNLRVLDIGTGANCIYPLIGVREYHWKFVGSDINPEALKNAGLIVSKNKLKSDIELRLQANRFKIFEGLVKANERFDLVVCNPPFHESAEDALKGTERKWKNLNKTPISTLNFGGKAAELWCEGGEKSFVLQMIKESSVRPNIAKWFTSLISKEEHLSFLTKNIEKFSPKHLKTISMGQGQKKSRLLAWSYEA